MISGQLARTVLSVLHHSAKSLTDMQIALADVPQADGIGVVWHSLREQRLIEPVRGTTAYRLTPTGIRREKDVRVELPEQVRKRLGLPAVKRQAADTPASTALVKMQWKLDARKQQIHDAIVSVVRRLAEQRNYPMRPREIYIALPPRIGGNYRNLDYSLFGGLLVELVNAGRLVWSGEKSARRYTVPGYEHLLNSSAVIPAKAGIQEGKSEN